MARSPVVPLIVIAAVVGAAFVLNPSGEQHRARIKEAVAERSPIAGALGLGSVAAFTTTYHPLGVASYTTAGDRVVSIGVLGMVFVLQQGTKK